MLTYERLSKLEHALRGHSVLSVYVDGGVTDPVGRARWRHSLARELKRARSRLENAPASERAAFDVCVGHLAGLLPPTIVSLYPPGWVAFIEPAGVRYAGSLHVAAPTSVTWQPGIRAAPYVRAFKQHQAAVAVVVDTGRARVYRYIHGALERVDTLHAPPEGCAEMMQQLLTRLYQAAGTDGWILVGGSPESVRELMAMMPEEMIVGRRVRVLSELDAGATDARVAAAAERGAMLQRRARDLAGICDVIDHAGSGGDGTVGPESTLQALREGVVQRVFLTGRFLREHPEESEELVRAAFDTEAEVEEASGDAAHRLDAEAGGVGARLRYVPANAHGVAGR